jgi:AcrR family transcriptional regulator
MPHSRKSNNGPFRHIPARQDSRPARSRISQGDLVQSAIDVLDDEGFDGLTMRRVAERLGIKAASLYNHVQNKDELLALVADTLCGEIAELERRRPWRQQLETVAIQFRQALLAHRDGARVLAATPPLTPKRLRIMEQILHALVTAGFSAAEATDAASVHNSYVVGFVLDEMIGRPNDTASVRRMRAETKRWFKSLSKDEYPTLVSLADELVDATPDRRFQSGTQALLDGYEIRLLRKAR